MQIDLSKIIKAVGLILKELDPPEKDIDTDRYQEYKEEPISDDVSDDFNWIGRYVIVRTYSAGVHFGYLKYHNAETGDVILGEARRLHYWTNAFTLNAVANGAKFGDATRISNKVNEIKITAIEIIPVDSAVKEYLQGYKSHEI